jgi:hypothetical protein
MRAGIVVNVTRADRHRLEAIALHRSAPHKHVWRAKHHPRHGRPLWHGRDYAPIGQIEAGGMEMAGAVYGRGVEGLTHDKTRTRPLSTDSVQKIVDLALGATRRRTRWTSNTGESGGSEPAIGATYLRRPPTRAASHPHVQAGDGPEFPERLKDVVGSGRQDSIDTFQLK